MRIAGSPSGRAVMRGAACASTARESRGYRPRRPLPPERHERRSAQEILGGTLGGKSMKFGGIDVVKFPDAFIFLRVRQPTGPTRGTAFGHVGFAVPNVPAMAAKLAAAGYREITSREPTPERSPAGAGGRDVGSVRGASSFLGPDGVQDRAGDKRPKGRSKACAADRRAPHSLHQQAVRSRCSSGT